MYFRCVCTLICVDSFLVVVEVVSSFLELITYCLVSFLVFRTMTTCEQQSTTTRTKCKHVFKQVQVRLPAKPPGRSDRPAAGRTMQTQQGAAQHSTGHHSTARHSTAQRSKSQHGLARMDTHLHGQALARTNWNADGSATNQDAKIGPDTFPNAPQRTRFPFLAKTG